MQQRIKIHEKLDEDAKSISVETKDHLQRTLLHYAAIHGRTDILEQLINKHADINAKDEFGYTPLDYAVVNGNAEAVAEAVKVLLQHGADVNAKDNEEFTALHYAAEGGHADTLNLLFKHGATK